MKGFKGLDKEDIADMKAGVYSAQEEAKEDKAGLSHGLMTTKRMDASRSQHTNVGKGRSRR